MDRSTAPALYQYVDLIHSYADDLERRLDGDRSAFTDSTAMALVRTVVHVAEAVQAIGALADSGRVVSLADRRREETR